MEDIRDIVDSDYPSILALNTAEERQTSELDRVRLDALVRMAAFRKVFTIDGQVAAFILVLRESAPYQNDNFNWFATRISQFLYVDRVVVDSRFSGRKIGSKLYNELFAYARTHEVRTITCEYNVDPPNPASRAFHEKFGFKELGTQRVAGGAKLVSLQAAETGLSATSPGG